MARVTVEDCIDKVDSPYELVLVAKERATQLNTGIEPTLDRDNDKNTVIALREIADETVDISTLKNDLIEEYQTNTFSEDDDINEIEDKSDDDQEETIEFDKNQVNKPIENDNQDKDELPFDTSQDNLETPLDEN